MILRRFGSTAGAAEELAGQIAPALRMGLGWRGGASLVVPGGRTPVPLFQLLRAADLDWSRVGVTLTDERWVPETDPASNAALLRRELLVDRAACAPFLPLYDGSADAAAAAGAIWKTVRVLPWPFDAVVLGMGEDGHFASLFPGNAGLAQALDPDAEPACVAMRAPVVPFERISLNLAALMQTRRLFLFATGEVKRDILLAAARRENRERWPVATLLAQRQPLPEVFWAP